MQNYYITGDSIGNNSCCTENSKEFIDTPLKAWFTKAQIDNFSLNQMKIFGSVKDSMIREIDSENVCINVTIKVHRKYNLTLKTQP